MDWLLNTRHILEEKIIKQYLVMNRLSIDVMFKGDEGRSNSENRRGDVKVTRANITST